MTSRVDHDEISRSHLRFLYFLTPAWFLIAGHCIQIFHLARVPTSSISPSYHIGSILVLLGIVAVAFKRLRLATLLGSTVVSLGFLGHLVQYLQTDTAPQTLLFRFFSVDKGLLQRVAELPPFTTLSFVLTGNALMVFYLGRNLPSKAIPLVLFGACTLSLATLQILLWFLGYDFGGLGQVRSRFLSYLSFAYAGLLILQLGWKEREERQKEVSTERWIVIAIGLLATTILLSQVLRKQREQFVLRELRQQTQMVQRQIGRTMELTLSVLRNLPGPLETTANRNTSTWLAEAQWILSRGRAFRSLIWTDSTGTPLLELQAEKVTLGTVQESSQESLRVVSIAIPFRRANALRGSLIAMVSPHLLFQEALEDLDFGHNLRVEEAGVRIYQHIQDDSDHPSGVVTRLPFQVLDRSYTLQTWPSQLDASYRFGPDPSRTVLILGLLVSLFLPLAGFLLQLSHNRQLRSQTAEQKLFQEQMKGKVLEAESEAANEALSLSTEEITDLTTEIHAREKAEAALRAAQKQLEQNAKELERSNRDLEQFAYVVSHDLQEPLRTVGSYTQLLAHRYRGKLDETADEFIHFAVDGVGRMQNLLRDLLEYSRVGRQDGRRDLVASSDLMEKVLANLRFAIEESNAEIYCAPLPEIYANPLRLSQLFQNLIGNALKFCKPNQPPKINISAQRQDTEWILSFRDHGIGIAQEHLEVIFTVFQRLHTRDEYPGTGIGLSICKRIVESLNGRIWVESKVGDGSTFHVALPIADPSGRSPIQIAH